MNAKQQIAHLTVITRVIGEEGETIEVYPEFIRHNGEFVIFGDGMPDGELVEVPYAELRVDNLFPDSFCFMQTVESAE